MTALDCDGLVPMINCLGSWACEDATCVFHCESQNPDCVKESECIFPS